jgi:hypothetical protein
MVWQIKKQKRNWKRRSPKEEEEEEKGNRM